MHTLQEDLAFAIGLATVMGAQIRAAGPVTRAVVKADGTPQTTLDVRLNDLFHTAVATERPEDLALGEEDINKTTAVPPDTRIWVCDPVDGTWLLPFALPYTVVSLALVVNAQPTVGVIYDPHANRTLAATRGGGAYLNGYPVKVNTAASLDGAVLSLPGSTVPGLDVGGMHDWAIRSGADVFTVGSVVSDAALVPIGFAAGFVYPYTSPWDMAAAAVITREAGGRITALDGGPQRYDDELRGAIVSNGLIHGNLVDLVNQFKYSI